ncbi:MAG: hypothetical protein HQM14_00430 [SAR324 cluster bacterium]|nr:hypothetical protein [SAR324 cluster bacterium]
MRDKQIFFLLITIFILLVTSISLGGCHPQRQTKEQQMSESLTIQVNSSTFASQNSGNLFIFNIGLTNQTNKDVVGFQGNLIVFKPSGEVAQKLRFTHEEVVRSKDVLSLSLGIDYSDLQSYEGEFVDKDHVRLAFEPIFIDFKGGVKLGKRI